ncbi:MAG: MAPEG family protein [Myxococcota bacterium]
MHSFAITLAYAGALGLWFVILTIRVLQGRVGKGAPSLGDGGDVSMLRRIRGHANFAEYVPFTLLMIGLLEASGTAAWIIHALGATLLAGRLLHGYAFAFTTYNVFGRSAGIVLTLLSLLAASVLCLCTALCG